MSYKNSFFSNMMSIRENDSIGLLGFGNDANNSRRETSIRKDSYQMNKLGQNRQSLDLFTIQKKMHEIKSEKDLLSEMRKQISMGNFDKKNHDMNLESIDMVHIRESESGFVNLYQPGSFDLNDFVRCASNDQINQEDIKKIELSKKKDSKGERAFEMEVPRKTFKIKPQTGKEEFFALKNSEEKKKGKKESLEEEMRDSLRELKEISTKQKKLPLPKLKDKLRHSKKTKKKKAAQFDNKEIRKEMKKFELETSGKKIVYESKSKVSKLQRVAKAENQTPTKAFSKKERFGRQGTGKGLTRRQEVIREEDEKEFEKKMDEELLNKQDIRKSLKHIIDQSSRS